MSQAREQLGSRIGFLLVAAGSAIGLGNVWRFPFVTGQNGGAAFVLIYILFLLILCLPILIMELAVGRAARRGLGQAFYILEPKNTRWHWHGLAGFLGAVLVLMFYPVVTGWMIAFAWYSGGGQLVSLPPAQLEAFFHELLADPVRMLGWTALTIGISAGVCSCGLQRGVERITKYMMSTLLVLMLILVGRAVTLPGAAEGIAFYLKPDFSRLAEIGPGNVILAAMGQAFFTISLGIGLMSIFGSYVNKDRSLTGEALTILSFDTLAALLAGMIIFPACSAFGVDVTSGISLVFVTMPNVFNNMPGGGRLWGGLFFIFMSFAALTSVLTTFECVIAHFIDAHGWTRKKSSGFCGVLLFILCIPCILGLNLWSDLTPLGPGSSVLDLEDFIVSANLMPLGALVFLFFCCTRAGWGWKNFIEEADAGTGIKFPARARLYCTYILPFIILYAFIWGYIDKFFR